MSKKLSVAEAWLEIAQRVDAGTESYLCNGVRGLYYPSKITEATRNAMLARIDLDLSARFGFDVGQDDCHVAYRSEALGTDDEGNNPDDDMNLDNENDARTLAALMFAHEAGLGI